MLIKQINIDNNFLNICKIILEKKFTENDWCAIESDDHFQIPPYYGGFDAIEKAFCFSYFAVNDIKYWFQVTLDEVQKIYDKKIDTLELRLAEC